MQVVTLIIRQGRMIADISLYLLANHCPACLDISQHFVDGQYHVDGGQIDSLAKGRMEQFLLDGIPLIDFGHFFYAAIPLIDIVFDLAVLSGHDQ